MAGNGCISPQLSPRVRKTIIGHATATLGLELKIAIKLLHVQSLVVSGLYGRSSRLESPTQLGPNVNDFPVLCSRSSTRVEHAKGVIHSLESEETGIIRAPIFTLPIWFLQVTLKGRYRLTPHLPCSSLGVGAYLVDICGSLWARIP